jgi:hypothetical protein
MPASCGRYAEKFLYFSRVSPTLFAMRNSVKPFRSALIALFVCGVIAWNNMARAGTTAIVIPTAGVTIATPQSDFENQFQNKMDKNGPAFADGFAMASTLGYAMGKATLGDFPHFQVGLTMNAGLTNMENFRHSKTGNYNGTLPGIGFAPALTLGVGLGAGVDVIGKFLMFNQDLYKIPKTPIASIDKYSFYEIGGRIRYNIVKEKTIIPFLFSFGGITISTGGDFMRGLVGFKGDYKSPFQVDVLGYTDTPDLTSTYSSRMSWYQISATTQALSYFSFFEIFSMYTGLGLSVGYGWFTYNFNANGSLESSDPTVIAALTAVNGGVPTSTMGTVVFKSSNKYHPKSVFPTYILGLELDIPFVKLITESQVNLRNRADVTLSLGVRVQF